MQKKCIKTRRKTKDACSILSMIAGEIFQLMIVDEKINEGDSVMMEQIANFCSIIGAIAGILGITDFCVKRRKPSLIVAIIGSAILLAIYLPRISDNTNNTSSGLSTVITATDKDLTVTKAAISLSNSQTGLSVDLPSVVTYKFSSETIEFYSKIKKDVYTGPGETYYRAANGKAQFINDSFIYGGRIGNWLFARCMVEGGGMRYGWINVGDYKNVIRRVTNIQFSDIKATVKARTALWDSLHDNNMGPIDYLESGTEITYLCNFTINGKTYAYVEASLSGIKACGLVDLNEIQ